MGKRVYASASGPLNHIVAGIASALRTGWQQGLTHTNLRLASSYPGQSKRAAIKTVKLACSCDFALPYTGRSLLDLHYMLVLQCLR